MKVGDLNNFLDNLPDLGDDAVDFAKDLVDIRHELETQYLCAELEHKLLLDLGE